MRSRLFVCLVHCTFPGTRASAGHTGDAQSIFAEVINLEQKCNERESAKKIVKTEVFVSRLEMFSIIVLPIFINISHKVELHKSSLDLNKCPELICVYKTHSYNVSLSSRLPQIPQLVFSVFVLASGALLM